MQPACLASICHGPESGGAASWTIRGAVWVLYMYGCSMAALWLLYGCSMAAQWLLTDCRMALWPLSDRFLAAVSPLSGCSLCRQTSGHTRQRQAAFSSLSAFHRTQYTVQCTVAHRSVAQRSVEPESHTGRKPCKRNVDETGQTEPSRNETKIWHLCTKKTRSEKSPQSERWTSHHTRLVHETRGCIRPQLVGG